MSWFNSYWGTFDDQNIMCNSRNNANKEGTNLPKNDPEENKIRLGRLYDFLPLEICTGCTADIPSQPPP